MYDKIVDHIRTKRMYVQAGDRAETKTSQIISQYDLHAPVRRRGFELGGNEQSSVTTIFPLLKWTWANMIRVVNNAVCMNTEYSSSKAGIHHITGVVVHAT